MARTPARFRQHFVEAAARAGWAAWLEAHAFVLCVEGGGVDPAPKAFEAVAVGSVPVVRRSDLDAAYRELGAAFVEEWEALTETALARWWASRRRRADEALALDFWWRYSLRGAAAARDVLARPPAAFACADGPCFEDQACRPAFVGARL